MARIMLVRHGEAAAGWTTDPDPGLSDLGRRQASAVADRLGGEPSGPVVTSPLRRTRETAAPLANRWRVQPVVEPRVAEVPTPSELSIGDRGPWLGELMRGRWADAGDELRSWRDDVVAAVTELDDGTVVSTHYVALNAVVGAATGDDRVICFHPDNCSMTIVETDGGLHVVALGVEAPTVVT